MKLKAKLVSCVVAIMLLLSVVVVGVLSVKKVDLGVGGNITFKAKGINAVITFVEFENCEFITASDATSKLKPITIDTTRNESTLQNSDEVKSWQGLVLQFVTDNSPDDTTHAFAKIKFSIENKDTTNNKDILVTLPTQNPSTDAMLLTYEGASTIQPGAANKQTYTITFTVNGTNDVNPGFNFNIAFGLQRGA